ncbi:MAG: DnaB-like helicase N-terminal domain-containing protein, partial [Gammaproteobacteria bacterium]
MAESAVFSQLSPHSGKDPRDLKIPPHSIEAEQAVLGGLMLDNRAWEQIGDRIAEVDFYRKEHRLIFRSIANLE